MSLPEPDTIRNAYRSLAAKRRHCETEAELRQVWLGALEAASGLAFHLERDNKDGSRNHIVLEFKTPGAFRGRSNTAKFKEATEHRLLPYILRESARTGIPAADYIGIATDGDHIAFAQVKGGAIDATPLLPFSQYAFEAVVQAVVADKRRPLTAENLIEDFGIQSSIASRLTGAMADILAAAVSSRRNSKIRMLFEEWRTLYGQVADLSVLQAQSIDDELPFAWPGPSEDSVSARLFVLHTYHSLFIKFLAAEIVAAHNLTAVRYPCHDIAGIEQPREMLDAIEKDIEQGALFAQANIHGFVEEALFAWYLDARRLRPFLPALSSALRRMLTALSLYRTDQLTHTHDILRDLYQNLIPRKLRQSLGEFYTPDWLVDFALEGTGIKEWVNVRLLDPTCGSGTFLIKAIRHKRADAAARQMQPRRILKDLCATVWGFDLNPLAVQTARVNFLMEIADLLRQSPTTDIEIPILLADAIYSPSIDPNIGPDIVSYRIGSKAARLEIRLPARLAFDRERLDGVLHSLLLSVQQDLPYKAAEQSLIADGLVTEREARKWRGPIGHSYRQVLDLHRRDWNGIWFRIVRNFFRSATIGAFDLIAGNPPWVRWSRLPEAYRERVKPTCERYGIFSPNKRHGGNELDISAMIAYTAADKWLKAGGQLVFLLTGTLFKNPSSEGFRKFLLPKKDGSSVFLRPLSVDDWGGLRPFKDAANHTVVARFDKSPVAPKHPIPYHVWEPAGAGQKAIPSDLTLQEVLARTRHRKAEAVEVAGPGSPWAVLPAGRHRLLQHISGTCAWIAGRKGITTDLNGVYFVPVLQAHGGLVQIRSRPEAGKKNIGAPRTAWVEPDLLYPLVKGAGDFEPCYLRPQPEPLYAIIPNRGITPAAYLEAARSMPRRLHAWFRRHQRLLEHRSTYRRQMRGAPYFAIYNVGSYTFLPWKVIWPEIATRFYAAVAGLAAVPGVRGRRPYIPDHKIYYASFARKEPAFFLCGLLNTPVVREWVQSHTISLQVGDVFKHLKLPEYRPDSRVHRALAATVERTHREPDPEARKKLVQHIERLGVSVLDADSKERR